MQRYVGINAVRFRFSSTCIGAIGADAAPGSAVPQLVRMAQQEGRSVVWLAYGNYCIKAAREQLRLMREGEEGVYWARGGVVDGARGGS